MQRQDVTLRLREQYQDAQLDADRRTAHAAQPISAEEAESGAALLAQLQDAFDELAEIARNEHLKAWRQRDKTKKAGRLAAKAAMELDKVQAHRDMIKGVLLGQRLPKKHEVRRVNVVVAQLRGAAVRVVIKQTKEAEELARHKNELLAMTLELQQCAREFHAMQSAGSR